MFNTQVNDLNHIILTSNSKKHNFLTFEPIIMKKNDLASIEIGSIIDIGNNIPKLYIYQDDVIVGQARLGQIDENESIIISAKERMVSTKKAGSKSTILHCRIAIIHEDVFIVSTLIPIVKGSLNNIKIINENRHIATARLVEYNNHYALEIMEINI